MLSGRFTEPYATCSRLRSYSPFHALWKGLIHPCSDFTTHGTTLINIWGDTATDRKILAYVFEKVVFDISTCVNGVILFENRYLDISNM